MRKSCGKYATASVLSLVESVTADHSPPRTGIVYAFQTPLRFDENSTRLSSGANDTSCRAIVSMKSLMPYCRGVAAAAVSTDAAVDSAATSLRSFDREHADRTI